jgi:ATP phosphoribosyltransferase
VAIFAFAPVQTQLTSPESGETMRVAGLKAISTVVESTAVLIKSNHPSDPKLVKYIDLIASRIRGVITAQKYVLCTYNIQRTKLEAASKITPGKRAPTVNSLDEEGWVAVQAMVESKKIGDTMDELQAVGAEDILVTKLENSRTSHTSNSGA